MLHLSQQQRMLLDALTTGAPVSAAAIVKILYDGRYDGGPEDACGCVRVQIFHLRQRLAEHAIDLLTIGRGASTHGYMIDPDHMDKLSALIDRSRDNMLVEARRMAEARRRSWTSDKASPEMGAALTSA